VLAEGTVVGLANHTVLISRSGGETCIDDSAAPIRDASGRILGVVLVFHDVTERRRLETALHERAERLVEADRRKDEFLAMLSHELRNPMATLVSALELMTDDTDEATRAWARGVLRRQSHHLKRLVDDLLDVSRITLGKIQLHREGVDLVLLAQRVVEAVAHEPASRHRELSVNLPRGPLPLDADPTRLEQVIVNLVHNALKFTPVGGEVRIELAGAAGEAVLTVADTGVGIDAESLSTIFEPFSQAADPADRSEGGLGIGLTLVRHIVELHGGFVSASSAGAGRGSQFTVRLPLSPTSLRSPTPEAATRLRVARHVLVVDDNLDYCESLARLLRARGYRVATAHDSATALARARAEPPDVVLLDIGLPGNDGYTVAGELRRMLGATARIVAVTGYGLPEARRRVRAAGFDGHLVKPISIEEVEDAM
jgi:signal transduction histidine kinase